tara:strand:- start:397 stop:594 length:198 start_codon:yes stop_codon:yes gene_type:complete
VAQYPQNVFFLFLGGDIYILKNDLVISKLKNLILSLMALEAELRGAAKDMVSNAIKELRKAIDKL